jgi:hypothetical protein
MNQTMSRLLDAQNRHDAEGMAACFAATYRSEQPVHPERGFGGREQVATNWRQMFDGIPDLEAEIIAQTTDGTTTWSECVWRGTFRDGSPFLMKGVNLTGLDGEGQISWQRLYMEPVEQGGAAIDETVQHLSGARH